MRLAGVVYTTSAAGLALRNVRGDVITATGSNPDIRAYATIRAGVSPLRRDVYGQNILGRRARGCHNPSSLSGEDRGCRLTRRMGSVRGAQQRLVGTVHQLYHSDSGGVGEGTGRPARHGSSAAAAAEGSTVQKTELNPKTKSGKMGLTTRARKTVNVVWIAIDASSVSLLARGLPRGPSPAGSRIDSARRCSIRAAAAPTLTHLPPAVRYEKRMEK